MSVCATRRVMMNRHAFACVVGLHARADEKEAMARASTFVRPARARGDRG